MNKMNFVPRKCLLLVVMVSASLSAFASISQIQPVSLEQKLAQLETSFDGKIGLLAINTANNQRIAYRADERFPVQSTFKVIAVAAMLKRSMTDKHLLQQKVTYTKHDLVFWSPMTKQHLADGMTIYALCSAIMVYSDNAATNLIVKKLGGPTAVIAFARAIGDQTLNIEDWEPDLNSNPKDFRDTSTPAAMAKSLQAVTQGDVLAPSQRDQLVTWMKGNTTGDARIRAGVPKGWVVADKTGASNAYGVSNDIGIIWPTTCAPIIVALYSVHNKEATTRNDEVIASTTRMVMNEFSKTDPCIQLKSS